MPQFSEMQKDNRIKLMLVGDSGMGKTSQLGTLANYGYKVRVMDLDNNMAVISSVLKDVAATDFVAEPCAAKDPETWEKILRLSDKWKTTTEDLGDPREWDSNTVLAVDSGTFACGVCLDKILVENKVVADKGNFDQSLWGVLAKRFENFVAKITSAKYKCHLIVTAHLNERAEKSGIVRTQPYFMGRHLPKVLPSYFNNTWAIDQSREGKRMLHTQTNSVIGSLRNSAPHILKADMELRHLFDDAAPGKFDLGQLFRMMEGK